MTSKTMMKELGRLIDNGIKDRGIPIAELSRRCRCNRLTIYNILYTEGYDPRLSTIISVAEALSLDLGQLTHAHKLDMARKTS